MIEDNFAHAEDTVRVSNESLVEIILAAITALFTQENAASAFGAVCREYYNMTDTTDNLIGRFIAELESINRFSR